MNHHLVLLGLALLVTCVPSATSPTGRAQVRSPVLEERIAASANWRRTANGWERTSDWRFENRPIAPRIAAVHPLVIAGLQLLLSVGVLLALTPIRPRRAVDPAR